MSRNQIYYSTISIISISTVSAMCKNWNFAVWVVAVHSLLLISVAVCDSLYERE